MERLRRAEAAVALVVSAAVLWGCVARKPGPSKDFPEKLAAFRKGTAVQDGTEKQLVPPAEKLPTGGAPVALQPGEPIWLQTGKSRVVRLPQRVTRVSIGDPELAGIVVLGPQTVMINAKRLPQGTGREGGSQDAMNRPGFIATRTLTPEPRMAETTVAFWGADRADPQVHTLSVADFIGEQVMLEVTVAELNRTTMEEHGIDFRQIATDFVSAYFMGGGAGPVQGVTFPPIAPVPEFPLSMTSDSPTFAFRLPQDDITAFLKLLQTEGLATILAQPKLVAMSGQNAVFQVGGEIPIRIATGFVADVVFKPFGTLVNFVPRVSEEGDIILTVTPEVSQPDFNSPVDNLPTFRTRRASTSTRLRNGETLVIGGLLQNSRREQVRGVPYLKDIPVVGYVFRDTRYNDEVTELMVVVTPRLVRPMTPGTTVPLPTDRGGLTNEEIRTKAEDAGAARPRLPFVP